VTAQLWDTDLAAWVDYPESFESAVLAKNPTNYWPANKGGGPILDIVAGHVTTMNGSQLWTPPSLTSQGHALNWPNNTTDYPSFGMVENAGDFTWQLAVEFDVLTNAYMLNYNNDGGYWAVTGATTAYIQLDGSFAISTMITGIWYLLHLVRSGGTATMYRNGVAIGSRASTQPFRVSNFGRYHSGNTFDGRMNHFARWSGVALSAGDLTDLYERWAA
jgi:hypothetical protein